MNRHRVAVILLTATLTAILPATKARPQARPDGNGAGIWSGDDTRGSTRRFDLTDEEVNHLMEQIKKNDSAKAAELEKLRKSSPEKFQEQIRSQAREEYSRIIRERMETWRTRRREEFIAWLGKEYPKEAQELANLNDREEVYTKKYDLLRQKYGQIYEEERRNPEMAKILKEDLELQQRSNRILARLKQAKNDQDKQKLQAELEETVGRRFDLIVLRRQIAYEQLLKRIEDLKRELSNSRDEIERWRDPKLKEQAVKERLKELTAGGKFTWD